MIGAHQSSPWMMFTILGSGSTVVTDESYVFGKTHLGVVLFSWLPPSPTHQFRCSLPSQCALLKTL
jgi:hypothetical protein